MFFVPCADTRKSTRAYRDHLKKWGMVKYRKRGDGDYSSTDSSTDHSARVADDTQVWSASLEQWPYRYPEPVYAAAYEPAPRQGHSQPDTGHYHAEIQPGESAASRMELVNVINQPQESLPFLHSYGQDYTGAGRPYEVRTHAGYSLYGSERSTWC